MRYLKKFKSINESYSDVSAICNEYDIENWTLNNDGSIDVDGDVDLSRSGIDVLPLKFRNVTGCFECSGNVLTSLKGSPQSIGDSFYCQDNYLTTLKGGPQLVSGRFNCTQNELISLEGAPKSIGGVFDCYSNNLTSLLGCPQSISGGLYCGSNEIRDFEGIGMIGGKFYCGNNPISEIWELFKDVSKIELLNDYDAIRGDEIILDRLNDFLRVIGQPPVKEIRSYKVI